MLTKPGYRRIPLWGNWDNQTPLANPHKGWYLHYFDNCIVKYLDHEHPDDYLEDFPCFNHIYLRLAWSYLEPEEGKFNWDIIDEVIERWTKRDRRVSFRISCKETGEEQAWATPEWVAKAGCKGEFTGVHGGHAGCFEPDYGDPIFLEKFGNFMRAFGERYNGKPWLEFVDIGSFGEWGEGHTEGTSERTWPVEVMKEHIDLHTKNFPDTYVIYNYDMSAVRRTYDGTEEDLLDYAVRSGCGIRADSACVSFYQDRYGLSSMHIPAMFQPFIGVGPMDLEFGHYNPKHFPDVWNHGYTGLAAVLETSATFAGFHGYARQFLGDHPHFSKEIGNLLGYWYFPVAAYLPGSVRAGQRSSLGITWENRGASPAYWRFPLYLKLTPVVGGKPTYYHLWEADNRSWHPKAQYDDIYSFRPDANLLPGEYIVSIGMFDPLEQREGLPGRPIMLGLHGSLRDNEGYYRIDTLQIAPCEYPAYDGVVKVESLWPEHPKSAFVLAEKAKKG